MTKKYTNTSDKDVNETAINISAGICRSTRRERSLARNLRRINNPEVAIVKDTYKQGKDEKTGSEVDCKTRLARRRRARARMANRKSFTRKVRGLNIMVDRYGFPIEKLRPTGLILVDESSD